VLGGGSVSGLTIDDPNDLGFSAVATVSAGGAIDGTTHLNGGDLVLDAGAVTNPGLDLIFRQTASLVLDSVHTFHGRIDNFGGADSIDLASVTFNGAGSGATTAHWDQTAANQGILSIADGSKATELHMTGAYTTANFGIQSDGAHGTLVTFV
jgi:hypothetical protein